MTDEPANRKMSAILSADVKGYSRLMGHDESADIEIPTNFCNIISILIKQYKDHPADSPTDNLLAGIINIADVFACAT